MPQPDPSTPTPDPGQAGGPTHRHEPIQDNAPGNGQTLQPGEDSQALPELQQLRTRLAEREQQLAALAAAHEGFLRAVSHDLRAPLRHITSYGPLVAEVLQDSGVAGNALAEAQAFLATMDQSARRMGKMLDGLLALSRIALAPLQRQPVALDALLAEVQAALAPHTRGRTVQWHTAPAGAVLHGDPALLRQLLTALLDNALKFTQGRAVAHISVQVQADGGGATGATAADAHADVAGPGSDASAATQTLRVQDNGAGFNPAQAAGLFGVFQRLHRETEFDGVGAGLAAVRAIAQRHGGDASATAEPGVGCTVSVVLPCS